MLDSSAILRDAHARHEKARDAKHLPRARRWASYRAAFRHWLCLCWRTAKELLQRARSMAALSALEEIEDADPTNYPARIGALRAYAATLSPNDHDGRRKIMTDADDLAQAARAMMIPFPGCRVPPQPAPLASLPIPFTADWQAEHLPLIDAAMDLLHADDAEFRRRCRLMADEGDRGLLAELSARLDQLGAHVGDVVQALAMTAARIRGAMTTMPA